MKRSIRIISCVLLTAALASPAWAGHGHGKGGPPGPSGPTGASGPDDPESQAGGLPALEDRVEADEALIATLQAQVSTLMTEVTTLQGEVSTLMGEVSTLEGEVATLQGQNNFAQVSPACTILSSSSSAGPVSATPIGPGSCEVTFSKNVSACSAVATIVGVLGGEVSVSSATKVSTGDSIIVDTNSPDGVAAPESFNLTVTCP
jgi:hypothetical protein